MHAPLCIVRFLQTHAFQLGPVLVVYGFKGTIILTRGQILSGFVAFYSING